MSREKEIPTGSYGTVFPSRRTATWDDRGYVDLKYEREFEGKWSLLARLYADAYTYRSHEAAAPRHPRTKNPRLACWESSE